MVTQEVFKPNVVIQQTEVHPARSATVALYTNIGCELLHYDVDIANAALIRRSSIMLPSTVQYIWPHASRRSLYVACGNRSMTRESPNCITALRIDPQTGKLSWQGESVPLPARPIHITTDIPSEHVLVAFSAPSGVQVFRINDDSTIGQVIPQPEVTDVGIFAHQIRVTPDNRHAILVTRGISATPTKPEIHGALKMFDYEGGVLYNEASIATIDGKGFGPRHLDFHPIKPWVYVSLERQNMMYTYRLKNGRLADDAAYRNDTLADPEKKAPRQLAGTIHVHPNGRFVYVANRADGTIGLKGKKVFAGGENNIAVFSINQGTGEPFAIQHIDTRKVYPRTFHIDPNGRVMVVQHTVRVNLQEGVDAQEVAPGMTIFRIGNDGKLTYERMYDLDGNKEIMSWMGLVQLP